MDAENIRIIRKADEFVARFQEDPYSFTARSAPPRFAAPLAAFRVRQAHLVEGLWPAPEMAEEVAERRLSTRRQCLAAHEYQHRTAERVLAAWLRGQRAIVVTSRPGSGKTFMALLSLVEIGRYMNDLWLLFPGKRPVLIVTPSIACTHVAQEIGKWVCAGPREEPCSVAFLGNSTGGDGGVSESDGVRIADLRVEVPDFVLTYPGHVRTKDPLLMCTHFSAIVWDESHEGKDETTLLSTVMSQLNAHFSIALSGTPWPNHIWDDFCGQLRAMRVPKEELDTKERAPRDIFVQYVLPDESPRPAARANISLASVPHNRYSATFTLLLTARIVRSLVDEARPAPGLEAFGALRDNSVHPMLQASRGRALTRCFAKIPGPKEGSACARCGGPEPSRLWCSHVLCPDCVRESGVPIPDGKTVCGWCARTLQFCAAAKMKDLLPPWLHEAVDAAAAHSPQDTKNIRTAAKQFSSLPLPRVWLEDRKDYFLLALSSPKLDMFIDALEIDPPETAFLVAGCTHSTLDICEFALRCTGNESFARLDGHVPVSRKPGDPPDLRTRDDIITAFDVRTDALEGGSTAPWEAPPEIRVLLATTDLSKTSIQLRRVQKTYCLLPLWLESDIVQLCSRSARADQRVPTESFVLLSDGLETTRAFGCIPEDTGRDRIFRWHSMDEYVIGHLYRKRAQEHVTLGLDDLIPRGELSAHVPDRRDGIEGMDFFRPV